ncbi:peptidase m20 [Trichococcus palustris]|uniref:Peptidase m20 n=1 Tax=Trichococcus palustris TaxID=140314 RepID=A0A143YNQ5_9LACT|nr:Zn-dependent hydrolase [Trichococcus palustris]CZQ92847.1 peptidase m20 [Trichococcus palustris]SFL06359.1 allantoate deiminase [Trichococcus palustris]
MRANIQRIQDHIETIGRYTATPGEGTTRLSYSEEDRLARAYIKQQMSRYGLAVREDAVGNIYGRLEGTLPGAPAVIVGSHFDSVPNGGSFDGPAGVVTGLEVAALFQEQQLVPAYPLEVIAMIEEEGSRFGGGVLGSRMIAGQVTAAQLAEMKDGNGISAAEAMAMLGFHAEKAADALRTAKDTKAFIELHIEQGPVLENAGEDVGLVDTIVGMTEIRVTIEGKAGHAGTTPMPGRADALAAAVTVIHQLPDLALQEQDDTVLTVGKLSVYPNGANVIPSRVVFTVDIRSKNNQTIQRILKDVHNLVDSVARDGITCDIADLLYMEPVHLSANIHAVLVENSRKLGLKYRDMVSGAGHDAMIFAGFTDVGLVFVPSRGGISHTPAEWTDYEHLQKGIELVFKTIVQLTEATV